MPTSTIWRQPAGDSVTRGSSPVRPTAESIERISPEPFFPSPAPETARHRRNSHRHVSSLQGLGLSYTGLLDGSGSSCHPNHLYIDPNGGAHVASRVLNAGAQHDQYQTATSQDWASRTSRSHQDTRRARGKGHTRSGSTIDDLASAAIATSPPYNGGSPVSHIFNGSPLSYNPTRPSTSYNGRFLYHDSSYEPPAKRVKSERLPTVEWSPMSDRPNTSYLPSAEAMNEEAALLLGLRTELNFKTHVSPPAPAPARIHYSPEQESHIPPAPSTPPAQRAEETDYKYAAQDQLPRKHELLQDNSSVKGPTLDLNTVDSIVDSPKLSPDRQNGRDADNENLPTAETGLVSKTIADDDSSTTAAQPKKIRRVKPQIQAEVCAECNRLQRETDGDDDATISWICCNGCERWFHSMCAGFRSKAEARSVDKFVCKECEPKHGTTTFVRKSSRARTAIDYAGLNQGLVKSSIDTSMHHYVQPIKDGKITFLPDDFARMRPELLTSEFMENFTGMKRPFVVPACWNPRFGEARSMEPASDVISELEETRYDSNGAELGPDPEDVGDEKTETVIDCDQDLLDMVMPRDLTVRKVADLYGPDEPVPVIDVKSQETKGTFTLSQWADYYELSGEKPIRNVISLEVSESRLGRLIRRPKVVRELDLEDHVWDEELRVANKKRPVQFYCLMSVADSYTDFHIDFGGSSVYYHILKGTKTFFFIPPEDRYLKKYEEWCNSDTQNETFLGDLCNNNCTRVDLHEGDTAFIPAGWIHAVWTPEDSLVIGGNFLTRLDYEMQLKVVNIEKVTKVSPKFRYPFFQKVMWYSLIKYLDDDPVPDDVMEEFQDDADVTFLRANPVWHEIGELANAAEPGTAEYNARFYPKSEIMGLPALRDFLYRTARIYADLPVADINKKQIDAVKASVPKGHGDPLLLIKIFAIWCAWKIGCVPVPEWVHTDAGGLTEIEKKKKVQKPEVFRLPGERTSLRKASQTVSRDSPDTTLLTPGKLTSTGSEVDSDSGKKSKSAIKSSSGLRVACDACRKRRIKCRHKEGETSPGMGDLPSRQRSYSTVSSEAPVTLAPFPPLLEHNNLSSPEFFLQETNLTSDLAQAALATLDSQLVDTSQNTLNGMNAAMGKKSRSKACEECRKSKRRCVHDEHGRVDPAKAAEPSKPRGSTAAKRPARLSDENLQIKRTKMELENETMPSVQDHNNFDALIDPALMNGDFLQSFEDSEMQLKNGMVTELAEEQKLDQNYLPQDVLMIDPQLALTSEQAIPLDPALLIDTSPDSGEIAMRSEAEQSLSRLDAEVQRENSQHIDTEKQFASPAQENANEDALLLTGNSSSSRHSSRQPKQVERYSPEDHRSPSKQQPKPVRTERRASSAVSGQTIFTSVKSRRSSSNTSGTTHQIAAMVNKRVGSREASARPGSRGSTAESDVDADEKFARELQAAENGLRRRASVRA